MRNVQQLLLFTDLTESPLRLADELLIDNEIRRINKLRVQRRADEWSKVQEAIINRVRERLNDCGALVDYGNYIPAYVAFKHISPDDPEQEMIDKLEKALSDVHWYEAQMVQLYIELGSYRKIQELTGIDFRSAGRTIKTALGKLKNKIKA